jgi:hypothetical protein
MRENQRLNSNALAPTLQSALFTINCRKLTPPWARTSCRRKELSGAVASMIRRQLACCADCTDDLRLAVHCVRFQHTFIERRLSQTSSQIRLRGVNENLRVCRKPLIAARMIAIRMTTLTPVYIPNHTTRRPNQRWKA